MPFPEVRHCVICDDIHREGLGKLTILGFYGLAPSVSIRVAELSKPIEQLTFLLICGPFGGGESKVFARIDDEHGKSVIAFEPGSVVLEKADTIFFAVGARNIQFTMVGKHRFTFTVDEKAHFSIDFTVAQATRDELKA